jgi:hypothetical protein
MLRHNVKQDDGRFFAALIGSSLSSTGMSADYSLALNRTKAGRASSPTRGAITNDPFPYAGPRERRSGTRTPNECNRNAPIWAGARRFSHLINGARAAFRCNF